MSIVYKISPVGSFKFSVKQVWEELLRSIETLSEFQMEQVLNNMSLPYLPHVPQYDPRKRECPGGDSAVLRHTHQMDRPYVTLARIIGEQEDDMERAVYHAFLQVLLHNMHLNGMDINIEVINT